MTDPGTTAAVVLAAGAGSRFGGGKLLAELAGRPLLDHVLGTIEAARLSETVVVVGPGTPELERIALAHGARVVVNPRPQDGLSSSVRAGLGALGPGTTAALVVLGDQPLTSLGVIEAVLGAELPEGRSIVVPRYRAGGGSNPALILAAAWPLARQLEGDRGFGPLIGAHPELVTEVEVEGDNSDVDTPGDLAALAWGLRVRADREQAERLRESPPPADFYGPVTGLFRADPRRTDDPVLDAVLALAHRTDRWLDVGAGAGRFALPLGLKVREVIALDPSPAMLAALRELAVEHRVDNVRTIEARWPPAADLPTGPVDRRSTPTPS